MSNNGSLTQRVGRGAFWQVAGGVWQTIVRLSASVVLARVLTPADYGVFGMAVLMREFILQFGNMGMGTGIIAKKEVTDEDLCTCFWSVAAVRCILFLVAVACAPLGSWFFNDPRVADVVRVVSLTFLFSILSGVSGTLMQRELEFKALNIIKGVLAVLESGLAVIMVLTTDWGYWILVFAMLFHALAYHAAIFLIVRWWPKFKFNKISFQYLFRYGINGLGFNFTNYLKQNLDYLLVGRILGTAALGLYEFAYRIPHMVQDRISRPLGSVAFPALSKIQDDNKKLAQGYTQVVKYVSLVSFPLLFGLAAVAHLAVPVLWGDQWLPVITPLRLLCICAVLRIIPQPVGAIFNCKNRPDIPFKISFFSLLWTAAVVGFLGYMYGIIGVATGMIVSLAPSFLSVWIAHKMLEAKMIFLFKSLLPILFSAICCAAVAYASCTILLNIGVTIAGTLGIAVFFGGATYILTIIIFFPILFQDIISKFKEVRKINVVGD